MVHLLRPRPHFPAMSLISRGYCFWWESPLLLVYLVSHTRVVHLLGHMLILVPKPQGGTPTNPESSCGCRAMAKRSQQNRQLPNQRWCFHVGFRATPRWPIPMAHMDGSGNCTARRRQKQPAAKAAPGPPGGIGSLAALGGRMVVP